MTNINKFDINYGFDRCKKQNGVVYFTCPAISKFGVMHGFSSRIGGVSTSPPALSSLNLGWHKNDTKENVLQNYSRLSDAAGFTVDSIALNNHEHGTNVVCCDVSDAGKGMRALGDKRFEKCDALLTNDPLITIMTLHADCVPVYLYDSEENVGSVIHSGWKGSASGIVINAIEKMIGDYNCAAKNIVAAVGPYISQANYEVDSNVANEFYASFDRFGNRYSAQCLSYNSDKNKYYLDLGNVIVSQFRKCGLREQNITLAGLCTYDAPKDFFSYRRDGSECGSMGAFLRVL